MEVVLALVGGDGKDPGNSIYDQCNGVIGPWKKNTSYQKVVEGLKTGHREDEGTVASMLI